MNPVSVIAEIVHSVIARGDLAHLALALWAATDLALVVLLLRELSAANRRFDDFVRELASFNGRFEGAPSPEIPHNNSSEERHDRQINTAPGQQQDCQQQKQQRTAPASALDT